MHLNLITHITGLLWELTQLKLAKNLKQLPRTYSMIMYVLRMLTLLLSLLLVSVLPYNLIIPMLHEKTNFLM